MKRIKPPVRVLDSIENLCWQIRGLSLNEANTLHSTSKIPEEVLVVAESSIEACTEKASRQYLM